MCPKSISKSFCVADNDGSGDDDDLMTKTLAAAAGDDYNILKKIVDGYIASQHTYLSTRCESIHMAVILYLRLLCALSFYLFDFLVKCMGGSLGCSYFQCQCH